MDRTATQPQCDDPRGKYHTTLSKLIKDLGGDSANIIRCGQCNRAGQECDECLFLYWQCLILEKEHEEKGDLIFSIKKRFCAGANPYTGGKSPPSLLAFHTQMRKKNFPKDWIMSELSGNFLPLYVVIFCWLYPFCLFSSLVYHILSNPPLSVQNEQLDGNKSSYVINSTIPNLVSSFRVFDPVLSTSRVFVSWSIKCLSVHLSRLLIVDSKLFICSSFMFVDRWQ